MLHSRALRSGRLLGLGRHDLALVAITMFWGTTFLIVHTAMRHSGPLFFVGFRFATAGLLSLLVFRKTLRGTTRRDLVAGVCVGVTIALGYALQTYGLQTVSSSTVAFITALYVPLVPLFQWLILRKPPKPAGLLGIACAAAGLVLLAGPGAGGTALGTGELATLGSAVAGAAEIVLISRFAGRVDLRRATVVQLLTASILCFLAMPATGESVPAFSWVWLTAAVGLGSASAIIQLTMNWAQQSVPPMRATVIYSGEPVWGGLVGRLAGDRLPGPAILGAALIVLGVFVSEARPPRLSRLSRLRRRPVAAAGQGPAHPVGSAPEPAPDGRPEESRPACAGSPVA
ncbi:DMT family transporter [Streptacidiphilus anmyonensis]|uniref:DMT family transporter n=1 Tax=Streptacidiphilus anmyonensis TaxID=405782 RepID=UPI0007C6C054|nr:DMT family transporter [Streptacidiphilus anmyonensis]